ncbi:bifunctional uridylyltransferase/uridylyl-removing enzyme [Betaproteobacteria bacterium]|nr:bifunctional uridylyltransferase/uridylyl-removing enzyme [Betaproteobacteria bacterium]
MEPITELQQAIAAARVNIIAGRAALRAAYEAKPLTTQLLHGHARLVDETIAQLWHSRKIPAHAALVAVGGYGRGELFPSSDVDLLFLLPTPADEALAAKLAELVRALWDIGLAIGHSVRTIDECLEAAAGDITIQTNLLEARLIVGDKSLFSHFCRRYREHLDVREFFKAKLLEREQRYARHNDTPYALEPNCKESPGGLRDLQMVSWIARAAGLGHNWRELARHRMLTGTEANDIRSGERFLQHVRIRLHYLTGREEDRLLFDHQEKLAHAMGIEATAAKRASEILMQRYYLTAKKLTQINAILLANYGNEIFTERSERKLPAIIIGEHFQVVRELLDIRNDDEFERSPTALLECFLLLQQRSELKGLSARTMRALWVNRGLINAAFRANPVHRKIFMDILRQKQGVLHALRRMNQYGILSRYLPSWRRILGQMQHDLFHAYTVDQHTLLVLRNVRRFTTTEYAHEYPLMTRLILAFERPWVLYIAALFHDIAKGRGGDHSVLGMADVREFCVHHEVPAEDTELAVWLVRHHLTMSHVAQKEDTTDPQVIEHFAATVATERQLTALYLLTHSDIRGTSPKVWNGWKGKLLEDLFFATRSLLRGTTAQQALGLDGRQENARHILRFHGLRFGIEDELWAQFEAVYFMRHSSDEIAWHTRMLYFCIAGSAPVVRARVSEEGESVQVMIYVPDQKDLFMRLCAFFSRKGFSILDAKIYTTRHGYALDSFMVQKALDDDDNDDYRDLIALIEHDLTVTLQTPGDIVRPSPGRLSRQVKHFPITPQVSLRPDEAGRHYILSLTSADRPGMLFDVAEVLSHHGINVETAKITTLGERAEDTFLLSGGGLAQDSRAIKVERELLDRLQL